MQRAAAPESIKRVLVSGGSGFIGARLVRALDDAGVQVTTIGRTGHPSVSRVVAGSPPWSVATWRDAITQARADAVIHLAGVRSGSCEEMADINAGLARTLAEALQQSGRSIDLIVAGSAAECGSAICDGVPVAEDIACAPLSDYGRSKYQQTQVALEHASRTGGRVLVARIFNPLGPVMPGHLALGSFARQIAAAPRMGGTITTGNLDVWRDQIDVDLTAHLLARLAMDRNAQGIVNVCSGVAYGLRAMLDEMIAASGKSISLKVNPDLLRGNEPRVIVGSVRRLTHFCGPLPRQNIKSLLHGMLADEHARIGRGSERTLLPNG